MRPRLSFLAFVLALLGFGASIASLIDYLAVQPTFCSESGCATVRASAWAHPLGVPMPMLGLAFFAFMVALSFIDRPRVRMVLAIGGGAWAIALIAIQALAIGAWCKLCMIVDPLSILLALTVVAGARTLQPRLILAAVALPAIAALPLVFLLLGHAAPPPIAVAPGTPDVIAREQKAGVATVVDFVDFECPFCRALAPKLDAAIAASKVPVHLVRKMTPLKMHPHAMTAALAWCCAEAQGKGDEMAKALFSAPVEKLTPEGCEQIAVDLGCDRDRYRSTLADPKTRERVVKDAADAKAAGVRGLPTLYIGTTGLGGADHEQAELTAAIEQSI